MSQARPIPAVNRLLEALPRKDRARFISGCTLVDLVFSTVLAEAGERIEQVYFPTESFISLVAPVNGHPALEVALVGNEGMTGTPLILRVHETALHALVQGEGSALSMTKARFCQELDQSRALQIVLHRYLHVLMSQLAQTAACNRFHQIEARLARWLLMSQDRAHSNQIHLTQEFMAYMLGVRRVGVTAAARSLQARNLIDYRRGRITINDRKGLEASACECYQADIASYNHIMGLGEPDVAHGKC
jgi:CRP-like cAMP-binding protein